MNESKKPKKPPKKHIADVEQPGVSAPSETSRPVIVTNRPLLKDPMVVDRTDDGTDEDTDQPPERPPQALSSSSKSNVQPLDDTITPDKDEEPADDDKAGKPAVATEERTPAVGTSTTGQSEQPVDETDPSAAPDPAPEDSAAPESAGNGAGDSSPDPSAPPEANPASADGQPAEDSPKNAAAKKAEAEAAEQAKRDAALQKLVDSKRYVLPINAVEKRQTKRFVLLGIGLSVILILVWLEIALDAGIFKLGGLHAPTHFFSN